jgi:hypothetical protein
MAKEKFELRRTEIVRMLGSYEMSLNNQQRVQKDNAYDGAGYKVCGQMHC